MRVLLPIIHHSLTECVNRAFKDAGHTTRVVNTRGDGGSRSVDSKCIAEARAFKPDLCFAQFQRPDAITAGFPSVLRDLGCFSVNWSGDVRSPLPGWYKSLAPHFDVTSFTNLPDVEEIRSKGHRAEFLQIGYDERLYNAKGSEKRSGVVFIGNNYGGMFPESDKRREMVRAMCDEFPEEFTVHGMKWEGVAPRANIGGYVREPDDARILRRSLVAVGYDHFHRAGFASDRLLRATACGCATVNQHYEGIEEEHPNVYAATSINDMVEKVRYLLGDAQHARKVGELSAKNTLKNHRWNNRVEVIESWMN